MHSGAAVSSGTSGPHSTCNIVLLAALTDIGWFKVAEPTLVLPHVSGSSGRYSGSARRCLSPWVAT
jgi:hypothetical protein